MAPGWLSHLELGWSIPAERMFHEALSSGRTLVRYDRAGCGLSDPYDGPRTMALELATIRAVTEALGATRFDLLGWSLGAPVAAQWAADSPETVSRMVLYGGWGLGSDLLTDLFAPETDAGTRRALAQYQRAASSAETAVALLTLAYDLDVLPALARVAAPTLVLHRRGDRAAPAAQSRVLSEGIPGAELVELDGRSHLPATGDSQAVVDRVRRFLGLPRLRRSVPTSLTPRQTEVAALVADGLTPHMGVSHLLFAVASTAYIAIGIRFEERDLRRAFGATYDAYAARVPALLPGLPIGRRARSDPPSGTVANPEPEEDEAGWVSCTST